jgi:hypothetical protein
MATVSGVAKSAKISMCDEEGQVVPLMDEFCETIGDWEVFSGRCALEKLPSEDFTVKVHVEIDDSPFDVRADWGQLKLLKFSKFSNHSTQLTIDDFSLTFFQLGEFSLQRK